MSLPEDFLARMLAWPGDAPDWPAPIQDSTGNWCEPFAWYDRATASWRTWQRCLVTGWEQFSGTWPRAGLTLNGIAYRRAPSVPLTSVTGFGLLPTPITNDAEKRGNFNIDRSKCLPGELRRGPLPEMLPTLRANKLIPTPRATDADKGGRSDLLTVLRGYETKHAGTLPTPAARDWRSGLASPETHGKNSRPLNETLSAMAENRSGRMNPRFREWMMGFPIGWTECEALATRSSRKFRRS